MLLCDPINQYFLQLSARKNLQVNITPIHHLMDDFSLELVVCSISSIPKIGSTIGMSSERRGSLYYYPGRGTAVSPNIYKRPKSIRQVSICGYSKLPIII